MTPASVDGGPDEGPVLKEVRRRHAIAWDNVAYGPHEPTAATYWQAQKDALSDLGEWLKVNELPRPSTRDAALREEGRQQGRAEALDEVLSVAAKLREKTAISHRGFDSYNAVIAAVETMKAIGATKETAR